MIISDQLASELIRELRQLRQRVGDLDMGHRVGKYSRVLSFENAAKDTERRLKVWDYSALGWLLQLLEVHTCPTDGA